MSDDPQRLPEIGWWQDLVGWGGDPYRRAGDQTWLDDTTSTQDYPEANSNRWWRVVASIVARPVCGVAHPRRGGQCVMPPGHVETPHVWAREGTTLNVMSLSTVVPANA